MNIKDVLIKVMSEDLNIPESTIDRIVTHQFDGAHKAVLTHNSIEISGFGKFLFNSGKAKRQMEKYLSQKAYLENLLNTPDISETKRRNAQMKMTTTIKNIKDLKTKVNGIE